MKLILTVPAHAVFNDIVQSPVVEAVRVNTTLPVKDSLEQVLGNLRTQAAPKDLWVDLKCRQLRIADYSVRIFNDREVHYVALSHDIDVNLPVQIWADNGRFLGEATNIIKGNWLVVPSSVEKDEGLPLPTKEQVGLRPGMSINILDPSLKIKGYLTEKDKLYIKAAKKAGMHNYMLSFVEQEQDIADLLALDPKAKIIAKIESTEGLNFVNTSYSKYAGNVNLMAARGDLYTEVEKPDKIIDACRDIIHADPQAILASRIFDSLKNPIEMPRCQDIFDICCGMEMGYKRFMLGDDVCLKKDSVKSAIGLFSALAKKYEVMP
jgi:pyruvate kinase